MTALPIVVPDGFIPVVSEGMPILVGEPLAKSKPQQDAIINVAEVLRVPLKKMKYVLKKNPGDAIEQDEIIAAKTGLFGISESVLRSKIPGQVLRYERHTGNLIIRVDSDAPGVEHHLVSPVEGMIALCNNGQIVIHTDKHAVASRGGVGEKGEGEVFVLEQSLEIDAATEESNLMYFLDNKAIGKVIVGGMLTRDVLMKGIGMGAAGLIGAVVSDEDLLYAKQKNVKTPILTVEKEVLDKLLSWKGKKVFIDADAKAIVFLQL